MRTSFGLLFALSLALAALGCGKSKTDQCNAFIDRANSAQGAIDHLQFKDDAKKLEADAAKIEEEATAVKAVELKDDKLVKLRDEYVSNLSKLASNVRELAKLHAAEGDDVDEAKAEQIEGEASKIEQAESKLVDEINVYCTGSI